MTKDVTKALVDNQFEKLYKAIEKGNLVFDMTSGPYQTGFLTKQGKETQLIQVYQFNGISIVKEEHEEHGKIWSPHPRHRTYPYDVNWTVYYVFRKNNLVSDEKEVKKIIRQVTGVRLPKLNKKIGTIFEVYEPFNVYDEVVTKLSLDKESDVEIEMTLFEVQPDEEAREEQLHDMDKTIESLPEEYGLSSLDVFLTLVNGIKSTITELSKDHKEKNLREKRKAIAY